MSNQIGYEPSDLQPGSVIVNDTLTALAVFTCMPNSHPFNERRIAVSEPVKVGRSVPRARPSPQNVIFDCKVLSRNHALLHYSKGTFLLEDTASSNGTFVNNQRLGKVGEENNQHEIFSGDHVQFGVDVTENARRVTHGCIIATVQLFHPDGKEARPSYNMLLSSPTGAGVKCQEMYQLSQYLQEAIHREHMLENKLTILQGLIQSTQSASDSGWQALIDEDRLLSRLEVLENQLLVYANNHSEDTLRKELVSLHEDKSNIESRAKESLQKVMDEKGNVLQKLTELENSLKSSEEECLHLREMCETSQTQLQSLAEKHEDQLRELLETQEKIEENEKEHNKEIEQLEQEKTELQRRISEMQENEAMLETKIESISADNDFRSEQLANMKCQIDTLKEKSYGLTKPINDSKCDTQGTQVDMQLDNKLELFPIIDNEEMSENQLKELLRDTKQSVDYYKAQLDDSEERLQKKQQEVYTIEGQLDTARNDILKNNKEIVSLEEKLRASKEKSNKDNDITISELQDQLNESRKQAENSNCIVHTLQEEIEELKKHLSQLQTISESNVRPESHTMQIQTDLLTTSKSPSNNANNVLGNGVCDRINQKETDTTSLNPGEHTDSDLDNSNGDSDIGYNTLIPSRKSLDKNNVSGDMSLNETLCDAKRDDLEELHEELNHLKGLLEEAKMQEVHSKDYSQKLRDELEEVRNQCKTSQEEVVDLQQQLSVMNQKTNEKTDVVHTLQEQLQKAEIGTQDVKKQVLLLRDRLIEEQQASKDQNTRNTALRRESSTNHVMPLSLQLVWLA